MLVVEMLKISNFFFFKEFVFVKENEESSEIFGRYMLKLPLYHGSRSTIR
jgi:hypothetical protein